MPGGAGPLGRRGWAGVPLRRIILRPGRPGRRHRPAGRLHGHHGRAECLHRRLGHDHAHLRQRGHGLDVAADSRGRPQTGRDAPHPSYQLLERLAAGPGPQVGPGLHGRSHRRRDPPGAAYLRLFRRQFRIHERRPAVHRRIDDRQPAQAREHDLDARPGHHHADHPGHGAL